MTEEEFLKVLFDMKNRHKKEEFDFKKKFAFEQSPVKIGDLIKDHYQYIYVSDVKAKISLSTDDLPQCVYYGPLLRKDGTFRKDGKWGESHQENIEFINGKKI